MNTRRRTRKKKKRGLNYNELPGYGPKRLEDPTGIPLDQKRVIPHLQGYINVAPKPVPVVFPTFHFLDGDGSTGINFNQATSGVNPSAVTFNSKLYIAWVEIGSVRVAVWNGSKALPIWSFVDGGASGISKSGGTQIIGNPRLCTFNSKLYLTWNEAEVASGGIYQIRVAVYNSNDSSPSWTFVDGNAAKGLNKDHTKQAEFPTLCVLSGKLYLSWAEQQVATSVVQVRVAVYNGNDGSPSWSFVDGNGATGINKNTAKNASQNYPVAMAVLSDKLYLSWSENDAGTGFVPSVHVAVYNGNDGSPSWTFVEPAGGINKSASNLAFGPDLCVFSSKLYATWPEGSTSNNLNIRVAVYNGNDGSPSWTFVDGNGPDGLNYDVTVTADTPRLSVSTNTLYLVWMEGSNGDPSIGGSQIHFRAYNGDDGTPMWSALDGGGAPGINFNPLVGGDGNNPSITDNNGDPYVSWSEYSGENDNQQIRVGGLFAL